MNLLGAKLYDPAVAVSKVTTSLLAQTAIDTTNLRIAFTVPAHGLVRVKMACVHHGSTTIAQVLLGILEGSTVRARVAPNVNLLQTAVATSQVLLWCDFTVAGLSPGAVNWDASYGVEIIASANGAIKYGGPNNTTTNDAFGAFVFEIWDPQPLKVGLDGGVNTTQITGTAQTARDIGASVLLSSGTGTGQVKLSSGYVAPNWGDVGNPTTTVGLSGTTVKTATDVETDTADIQARLPAALTAGGNMKSDMLALNGGTQSAADLKDFADDGYDPSTNKVQGVVLTDTVTTYTGNTVQTGDSFARIGANGAGLTALGDARIANLDAAITTRAAAATALSTAQWTNGRAALLDNLDAAISTRMATFVYTAPDNASIGLIKAQTDKFTFSVANVVDANILAVNSITVDGAGTAGDPWGPV